MDRPRFFRRFISAVTFYRIPRPWPGRKIRQADFFIDLKVSACLFFYQESAAASRTVRLAYGSPMRTWA